MLTSACLFCGYARTGLPPAERCPECGESPPPTHTLVLHGDRLSVARWMSAPLFAALLLGLLLLAIIAARSASTQQKASWIMPIALTVGAVGAGTGLVRVLRGAMDHRNQRTWILHDDALEIIEHGTRRALGYDRIATVEHALGVTLRSRLKIIECTPFLAVPKRPNEIWLDDRALASTATRVFRARADAARMLRS